MAAGSFFYNVCNLCEKEVIMMQLRPKGTKDPWYNPERDILNISPSLLVRGAAFVAKPSSSLYKWLAKQLPFGADVRKHVRDQMAHLLKVMYESRRSKFDDHSLNVSDAEWPAFQAIMCGTGVVLMSAYAHAMQATRMTDEGGVIIDAVEDPDMDRYLKAFDDMTGD